ncbi:MAG: helix-turn-helix domain-containing protein [Subdoligranulum sp.]|nr:helix-turn-helix domain-containing protein [Subdoligranulum sp.]
MAIFRVEKTKDFTVMSNHHLRNTELSLKAKGLLSLMLSLPEGWDYTTKGLAYICRDGVDSISTALRELEQAGYLTRHRLRRENGQLGDIEYTIHERPVADTGNDIPPDLPIPEQENPVQAKPMQEKPIQEKHAQLNTNQSNTEESNTDQSIYPGRMLLCAKNEKNLQKE